mgnify:FL=1
MRKILQNSVFLEAQISAFLEHGTVEEVLNNPNFVRWFGDSKVVDSEGNPLVVYHGTNRSFDEFGSAVSSFLNQIAEYVGYLFTPNTIIADDFYNWSWIDDVKPNVLMPVYLSIQNPYRFPYDESLVVPLRKLFELLITIKQSFMDFLISTSSKEKSYANIILAISQYATYMGENDRITDLMKINMFDNMEWALEQVEDAISEVRYSINEITREDPWRRLNKSLENALSNCRGSFEDVADKFLKPLLSQGYDGIILSSPEHISCGLICSDQYIVFSPSQVKSIYNNGSFYTLTSKISEELS